MLWSQDLPTWVTLADDVSIFVLDRNYGNWQLLFKTPAPTFASDAPCSHKMGRT